jgi:hypothetical protein
MTNSIPNEPPEAAELYREFCYLTNHDELTRRSAVAALAKRHHIGANAIYKLIEAGKKSGQ